jgi:hypothetical protein
MEDEMENGGGTGGPSWRLKGAMAPPTQLKFTQYYLVFISFDHIKYKIFQISPLNFYVMTFGPSYNDGQGPPLGGGHGFGL